MMLFRNIRHILVFCSFVVVIFAMPSPSKLKKVQKEVEDEAGDKALKILLDGAILYTDLNGFKIYVKPGNEFEAQVQWFLLDPREIIHYKSGKSTAVVGTRYVSFHPQQSMNDPAGITISGRNSVIPIKAFYYKSTDSLTLKK